MVMEELCEKMVEVSKVSDNISEDVWKKNSIFMMC